MRAQSIAAPLPCADPRRRHHGPSTKFYRAPSRTATQRGLTDCFLGRFGFLTVRLLSMDRCNARVPSSLRPVSMHIGAHLCQLLVRNVGLDKETWNRRSFGY